MKISPTFARVAMICGVVYGVLIAAIRLGFVSSGEHSMILLYWLLMPTIRLLPEGVLEKMPLFLTAGLNILLILAVIHGAFQAVRLICKKEPDQPPETTRGK